VSIALVALVVSSCSSSGSNTGSAVPSTIAPGSPWVGTLDNATLPAPVNSLTGVDCVSALRCWAAGSTLGTAGAPNGAAVVTTVDGGATWTIQPIPSAVGYLSDISCSDRHYCAAVGQVTQTSDGQGAIITTSDGGRTWTAAAVPSTVSDVTAIDCQADRRCMAIGTVAAGSAALVSSAPGAAWTQLGTLPAGLNGASGISCPDSHDCWVTISQAVDVDHVTGQVALTVDGGSTWSTTATPKTVGYLNDIVCARGTAGQTGPPSTSTTTSVPGSTTTTVPGSTTTTPPPPTSTTTTVPAGVSGTWCVAVGTTASTGTGTRTGHGVILTTTDGGTLWSSQVVSPTSASLMGVSCPAFKTCVAVGSAVGLAPEAGLSILTGPVGHPWKRAAAVTSPQALTAVSCLSLSDCVLVGESISQHLSTG